MVMQYILGEGTNDTLLIGNQKMKDRTWGGGGGSVLRWAIVIQIKMLQLSNMKIRGKKNESLRV